MNTEKIREMAIENKKDAKEKAELKKRMAASLAWSRRLREQQCGRTLGL